MAMKNFYRMKWRIFIESSMLITYIYQAIHVNITIGLLNRKKKIYTKEIGHLTSLPDISRKASAQRDVESAIILTL